MLQSIWEDVKREFSYGNMVTRIIIINVVIFIFVVFVKLILQISFAGDDDAINQAIKAFIGSLSLSSNAWQVLFRPWTIFTHMFLHEGIWHILWNMLYLYWFGRIVGDFIGNQRVLPIYLLAGLAGGAIYLLIANTTPFFFKEKIPNIFYMGQYALGASAGVMGVAVAAGAISPDYIIRLLFLGDVKLKYLVGFMVLLDLIVLSNGNIQPNTGGAFAHLAGAAMGWVFVRQLREGNDWALPINNLFDKIGRLFKKKRPVRRPQMAYKNPNRTARTAATNRKSTTVTDSEDLSEQEQLDTILDKIKQSGYESLTAHEKEFLFNASKK